MWQRIQSVFIGIAIVGLLASLFLPVWELDNDQVTISYRLYPIYFMTKVKAGNTITAEYFPFCASAVLIVAALTVAVQQFRRFDNRMLQIKLGTLNSLLLAGVMLCNVLFSNQVMKAHPGGRYELSFYLAFAAVACNWIAMRFIRRDEKLVRDSDRLR